MKKLTCTFRELHPCQPDWFSRRNIANSVPNRSMIFSRSCDSRSDRIECQLGSRETNWHWSLSSQVRSTASRPVRSRICFVLISPVCWDSRHISTPRPNACSNGPINVVQPRLSHCDPKQESQVHCQQNFGFPNVQAHSDPHQHHGHDRNQRNAGHHGYGIREINRCRST